MRLKPAVESRGTATPGVVRGWTSLIGLIVFVCVPPALLVLSGNPPPLAGLAHALKNIGSVVHWLAHPVSDQAFVAIAISAAWLGWLWLTICVVVEVAAKVRGKEAAVLPGSRHLQAYVAVLVTAAVLLTPITRWVHPRLSAHPVLHRPAPASVSRNAAVAPGPAESLPGEHGGLSNTQIAQGMTGGTSHQLQGLQPSPEPSFGSASKILGNSTESSPQLPAGPSQADRPEYVVQPGDTLWSIAQSHLGSPLRWPEIASLNLGRIQPDGETFTDDNWIMPGWVLVLPEDSAFSSPVASSAKWDPVPLSTPDSSSGDSVVFRGGATAGAISVLQSPTAYETALVRNGFVDTGVHPQVRSTHGPNALAPFGYGLLGGGVVILVDRLRRAQQRRRPAGARIALPSGSMAESERRLRCCANEGEVTRIDYALRLLADIGDPPQVVAVRVAHDGLTILCNPATPTSDLLQPEVSESSPRRLPPTCFEPLSERRGWRVPAQADLEAALGERPWLTMSDPPNPGLVTIGRYRTGILMVDLCRVGTLAVSGPDAMDILRSIVLELSTMPWADPVDVLIVGFEAVDMPFAAMDRVRFAPSLGAAETLAERHLGGLVDTGSETWDRLVVVCSEHAAHADDVSRWRLACHADASQGRLAVIFEGSNVPANWELEALDPGPAQLRWSGRGTESGGSLLARDVEEPLGERPAGKDAGLGLRGVLSGVSAWDGHIEGQMVGAAEAANAAAVVALAASSENASPHDAPYDALEIPVPSRRIPNGQWIGPHPTRVASRPEKHAAPQAAQEPEVQVLVLGPVEVVGAQRPFTRAWSLELVVYLAMHPKGATSEQWATALWPDRLMAPSSLHSTASSARRALGVASDGSDHLPRSHGRLALGPTVRSDWDRFAELATADDPQSWKKALELVRGRPFDGLRASDWVVLEGIQATIEAEVVDLAQRCAQAALASGDAFVADWAARQGLRACPYDERLYRAVMLAADLAGNPAGVEAAMSELLRLVADEVEPYDAVHPETLDLYRRLSRRSPATRQ